MFIMNVVIGLVRLYCHNWVKYRHNWVKYLAKITAKMWQDLYVHSTGIWYPDSFQACKVGSKNTGGVLHDLETA